MMWYSLSKRIFNCFTIYVFCVYVYITTRLWDYLLLERNKYNKPFSKSSFDLSITIFQLDAHFLQIKNNAFIVSFLNFITSVIFHVIYLRGFWETSFSFFNILHTLRTIFQLYRLINCCRLWICYISEFHEMFLMMIVIFFSFRIGLFLTRRHAV